MFPQSACATSYAVRGPLHHQAMDLVRPGGVHREAVIDQRAVVVDRLAVSGKHELNVHLPGEAE